MHHHKSRAGYATDQSNGYLRHLPTYTFPITPIPLYIEQPFLITGLQRPSTNQYLPIRLCIEQYFFITSYNDDLLTYTFQSQPLPLCIEQYFLLTSI